MPRPYALSEEQFLELFTLYLSGQKGVKRLAVQFGVTKRVMRKYLTLAGISAIQEKKPKTFDAKSYSKQYYQLNKEVMKEKYKDQRKAYFKAYHEAHRDHRNAYTSEWSKENDRSEYLKAYRKANPPDPEALRLSRRLAKKKFKETYPELYKAEHKAHKHARQASIKNSGGKFTKEEWLALKESFGFQCPGCGTCTEHLSVDHILPIDKGGSNWIWNIQPLCFSCNCKKHTETVRLEPWSETCLFSFSGGRVIFTQPPDLRQTLILRKKFLP
jgi:5-methylcytosine-specific restriction endonuclease McrA